MSIISLRFIFLIILTYLGCLITPQKFRWIILLISSLVFYSFVGIIAFITIIIASALSYCGGLVIERCLPYPKKKKTVLIIGIILILGWLILGKLNAANHWSNKLIMPVLGISYVSFTIISYFLDIYWERDKADRNPFKHILYVLYFPKITQGPIVRHSKTIGFLYAGGELSYRNLSIGFQRMVLGYFKKLIIANRLSMITAGVFSNISSYSGSVISVAVALATLELYFDFSGYMDIILGFSRTLGIEMDENFDHPFLAKSAAEFWRRWHITLGSWFKDYVYTPIVMSRFVKQLGKRIKAKAGKKTGNAIMKAIALLVVWILTGLWHGTGLNYITWGLFWGSIIVLSVFLENTYKKINAMLHINNNASLWRFVQSIRIYFVFCFGILLTRIGSLHEIRIIGHQILHSFHFSDLSNGVLHEFGVSGTDLFFVLFFIALYTLISVLQNHYHVNIREKIASLNIFFRGVFYVVSISIIIFFGIYGTNFSTNGFSYTYF